MSQETQTNHNFPIVVAGSIAPIGKQLERLRTSRGLTREELARRAGIENGVKIITRIEEGKGRPIKAHLHAMEVVLGVKWNHLVLIFQHNKRELDQGKVCLQLDVPEGVVEFLKTSRPKGVSYQQHAAALLCNYVNHLVSLGQQEDLADSGAGTA